MRWEDQKITNDGASGQPALLPLAGLVRTVRTPEFDGITFHEVTARSVLNRVPPTSSMPFSWTINPFRGCSHACVYCFARKTHSYLNLDTGLDFDAQLIVKINAEEVLRRELARPSWTREHVALGTNTDPYQRAEGRYRLMPGIISALADSGTPFSILTKGTLLARDVPLLKAAAQSVSVGMGISLALIDPALADSIEPGTPAPKARLALISRLREAGLPCGVMAMPILPWLTDGDDSLDELFAQLAAAGATGVSAGPLHLRPGSREWFMQWLAAHHPRLVPKYDELYHGGAYASKDYREWLSGRIRVFRRKHGLATGAGFFRNLSASSQDPANAPSAGRPAAPATRSVRAVQAALF